MIFVGKLLDEITEQDLIELIGVSQENNNVDFKEDSYNASTSEGKDLKRNELRRDIAAFANANGGWLICGMKAQNGIASDLSGLGGNLDPDREKGRLEEIARKADGIEPSVLGLGIIAIKLSDLNKGFVIVIRIPKSGLAPHWVKINGMGEFWIRGSIGKQRMNMHELRERFLASEGLVNSVRAFRKERIELLATESEAFHAEIPFQMSTNSKLVLHLIPYTAFDGSTKFDVSMLRPYPAWIQALKNNLTAQSKFNLEGIAFSNTSRGDEPVWNYARYLQIFRTGAVEYVSNIPKREEAILGLLHAEEMLIGMLTECIGVQKHLSIESPSALMVSIINNTKLTLIWERGDREILAYNPPTPLTRKWFLLPDTELISLDEEPQSVLKPIFDMVWNLANFSKSKSYDKSEKWAREYKEDN